MDVVEIKPWLLEVWEKLPTKAPCPDKTQPYCCYVNTVIFYLRPFIRRPWSTLWLGCRGRRFASPAGGYEKWDEVKTGLRSGECIEHAGRSFEITGGAVVWRASAWWMKYSARRLPEAGAV